MELQRCRRLACDKAVQVEATFFFFLMKKKEKGVFFFFFNDVLVLFYFDCFFAFVCLFCFWYCIFLGVSFCPSPKS